MIFIDVVRNFFYVIPIRTGFALGLNYADFSESKERYFGPYIFAKCEKEKSHFRPSLIAGVFSDSDANLFGTAPPPPPFKTLKNRFRFIHGPYTLVGEGGGSCLHLSFFLYPMTGCRAKLSYLYL